MLRLAWRASLGSVLSKSLPATSSCCLPVVVHTGQAKRMSSSEKHGVAKRLRGTEKNIWVEFGKLATDHGALNLGQGFPDFHPPQYVRDELMKACSGGNPLHHQYTRSYGHTRLVQALAKIYSPLLGQKINPLTEVLISVGAYGALFCAIQGNINPGDEVIIIEPFFDCYDPMVTVAGGKPVFIPLRPTKSGVTSSGDWKLDPDELASKFNENTKMIILNTPNNPLGKVFTREELEPIADLCKKYDVICIADEVYEWLVFSGNKHVKIATLPGMWERTLTIGSAGKTFSATGWKLGWTIGPAKLMQPSMVMHQNCNYTCPTITQEAVAGGFEMEMTRMGTPQCYFLQLPAELEPKRDRLAGVLEDLGMEPVVPEGGYFMMANIQKFAGCVPKDGEKEPFDFKFVRWMTKEKKLAVIPPSAFYGAEHKSLGEMYIRFCFIKEDSTLDKAEAILREWKNSMS